MADLNTMGWTWCIIHVEHMATLVRSYIHFSWEEDIGCRLLIQWDILQVIQFSFVITIDTTSLRAAYQLLFPLPIHNRHTLNCMLETQRLYQIPRRCLDLDSCLQLSHQAPIHLPLECALPETILRIPSACGSRSTQYAPSESAHSDSLVSSFFAIGVPNCGSDTCFVAISLAGHCFPDTDMLTKDEDGWVPGGWVASNCLSLDSGVEFGRDVEFLTYNSGCDDCGLEEK